MVAYTPRAARTLGYAVNDSLTWHQVRELVLPGLDRNWMTDLYLGPVVLIAALAGLVAARPGPIRRERLFWLGLAGFALLCALGRHGGILVPLARWVPGFGLFRIPYRYKLITGFSLALLCGDGIGAILRRDSGAGEELSQPAQSWTRIAVGAAALVWIAIAGLALAAGAAHAVVLALVLGGPAAALCAASTLDPRRARWHMAAAVALTLADLWVAGGSKIDILQPPPRLARDAQVLDRLDGVRDHWRFFRKGGPLDDHAASILDARDLSGYPNPFVLDRIAKVISQGPGAPTLLRRFNVRYQIGRRPGGSGVETLGRGIFGLSEPVPVARVYPRAERVVQPARVLARLSDPAPLDAVLIDPADLPPGAAPLPDSKGPPTDGRVVAFDTDRMELEVAPPAPGILVVNEVFFPGWQAEVGGRPAPVFRVNYALRGVVVPAGPSRVVLSFHPPGLRPALAGFVVGLLLLLAAALPRRVAAIPLRWARRSRPASGAAGSATGQPEA